MLSSKDRLILLLLPGVAIFLVYFVRSERWVYNLFIKDSSVGVGQLFSVDGDVRKRPQKELFWIPVHKGDSIDQSDTLFVGANSAANFSFGDDTKVDVDSNSILTVESDENGKVLHIDQGGLNISSSAPTAVAVTTRDNLQYSSVSVSAKPAHIGVNQNTAPPPQSLAKDPQYQDRQESLQSEPDGSGGGSSGSRSDDSNSQPKAVPTDMTPILVSIGIYLVVIAFLVVAEVRGNES